MVTAIPEKFGFWYDDFLWMHKSFVVIWIPVLEKNDNIKGLDWSILVLMRVCLSHVAHVALQKRGSQIKSVEEL